jgi:2,5-dioxopentanoate dehydrogenase
MTSTDKDLNGLTGLAFIAGGQRHEGPATFRGKNPATGAALEPPFGEASAANVAQATALADEAFDVFRETAAEIRAAFLETIAANILALGDELVDRAMAESGLPRGRIEGERGRTVGQLRLFASVVRDGLWLDARIDPALPDRKPLARSDLRLRNIAIGPVAVFGASNFPLAFSVAGGDTASALAAGCPVVVKAHSAHPATSALIGRAIQDAVKASDLPDGVFSMLFGIGNALGAALVADPRIKAVGFTGSRQGGLALVKIAAQRAEPIPVYAEMSSINPVILFPGALAKRAEDIAKGFVGSLTMGAGQFCTNPGLILALDSPDLQSFIDAAAAAMSPVPAATMLTSGIFEAYTRGLQKFASHAGVAEVARGQTAEDVNRGQPALFMTEAKNFLADKVLSEEVFGASSLIVRCADGAALRQVLERLEGQLTITLQLEDSDTPAARALLPVLERKAGRLLVNGWPTGVEVCHAMVHGGPFPATSDSRTTSVGTLAIRRFLRPVCYQDFAPGLLPEAIRDGNPFNVPRLLDGKFDLPK